MKGIRIRYVVMAMVLAFISSFHLSAQILKYCPTDTCSTWLTSQATIGPADLITESAVETKQQKFNLSYALVNIGEDVIQVDIEL